MGAEGANPAGAAGNAGAKAPFFGAFWRELTGQHLTAAQVRAKTIASGMQTRVAGIKWTMPVDVKVRESWRAARPAALPTTDQPACFRISPLIPRRLATSIAPSWVHSHPSGGLLIRTHPHPRAPAPQVDFLRPAMETVRETLTTVWVKLPPPVQAAAPYVGVGAASGLVVFALQQRRVGRHRRHGEELAAQVAVLRKDKEALLKRINLLKAKSGAPRTEIEARMAMAVAEATNAAAAAADAAARAATACIFNPAARLALPPPATP